VEQAARKAVKEGMSGKHKLGIAMAVLIALASGIVFAARSAQPRVTMAAVARASKQGFVECVIGLTNNGGAITYCGYSKQIPIYTQVYETPTGPLTNSVFFCGTGLGDRTLAANEGVLFTVCFAETNPPARILVNYKHVGLLDRLVARAPAFIRSKLRTSERHTAELRLSS
jgi:hypothetical protein